VRSDSIEELLPVKRYSAGYETWIEAATEFDAERQRSWRIARTR